MKITLYTFVFLGLVFAPVLSMAQGWVNIPTPVTDNLILYDIRFPSQQNDTGYVAGSNYTFNGKARVMKTTDGGLTWNIAYTSDVKNTGIMCMDFTSTSNGFAGTMGGDLLVTTDGGSTWIAVDIDPTASQGEISTIEFYSTLQGILITQYKGTYMTSDGGTTWTKSATQLLGLFDLDYASETVVFASAENQRIFKSTDKGNNWTQVFNGSKNDNYNIAVDFVDELHGVVSSENGEIFITNDGGSTWTTQNFSQGGLLNDVQMKTIDRISIVGSPGQVFHSNDGGINWQTDSTSWNIPVSYNKIIHTPNGVEFVCGSGPNGGNILRKVTDPLGINTIDALEISIAPNPIQNHLNISLLSESTTSEITIVNLQGVVIWNGKVNTENLIINTSDWTSGVYFITVQSDSKTAVKRLVKM